MDTGGLLINKALGLARLHRTPRFMNTYLSLKEIEPMILCGFRPLRNWLAWRNKGWQE
jgi:hypothetical protein